MKHKRQCIRKSSSHDSKNHDEFISSEDIILTILNKLPLSSLMRFKCVSKRWHNLITHWTMRPRYLIGFIMKKTDRSITFSSASTWLPYRNSSTRNHDNDNDIGTGDYAIARSKCSEFLSKHSLHVVSSSKGVLLCTAASKRPRIYNVYNPFTNQKIALPLIRHPVPAYFSVKIGFDCQVITTDEASGSCVIHYVVLLVDQLDSADSLLVRIYSSREELPTWKEISIVYPINEPVVSRNQLLDFMSGCHRLGPAIGGVFYWLSEKEYRPDPNPVIIACKPVKDQSSCRFWKVDLPDDPMLKLTDEGKYTIGAVKDSHLYLGATFKRRKEIRVWTCKLKADTSNSTDDDHVQQYIWKPKHVLKHEELVERHPEEFREHPDFRHIHFKGFHPSVPGIIFFTCGNNFMSYTFKGKRLEAHYTCKVPDHIGFHYLGNYGRYYISYFNFLPFEWLSSPALLSEPKRKK